MNLCTDKASSSGNSSGSNDRNQNAGDLLQVMDQRKRKRMISNRDSARRSRMKKQKHMEELVAEASQLSNENNLILENVNLTTELFLNAEAENSVVRAQIAELTHRLRSLNDIINCLMNARDENVDYMMTMINPLAFDGQDQFMNFDNHFMNPLYDWMYLNQPIMGSSDLIIY